MKTVDRLTDELISITDIGLVCQNGEFREYDLITGTAMTWMLFSNKKIQVVRAYLSAGAIFPLHEHEVSAESITLYDGELEIYCECKDGSVEKIEVQEGVPVHIERGQNHKLVARSESRVIAILIPPDKILD